jgi:hypothetical protein
VRASLRSAKLDEVDLTVAFLGGTVIEDVDVSGCKAIRLLPHSLENRQ